MKSWTPSPGCMWCNRNMPLTLHYINKLPLPSGIIYLPPWKPLLTLHITSWNTIIPPLCHSYAPKLNRALNLKLTFSTNLTLLSFLIPVSDWSHFSTLQAMAMLTTSEHRGIYQVIIIHLIYGCITHFNFMLLLTLHLYCYQFRVCHMHGCDWCLSSIQHIKLW